MYIVAIAWMYVVVLMSVAEATNANGTLLGAIVTFIFYGLLPVALVVYLMRSPARSRANKAKRAEFAARTQAFTETSTDLSKPNTIDQDSSHPNSFDPNTASHAPAAAQSDGVSPVRKVP
jgi:hypothetical protein